MIRIKVPGTTANLGPGFDTLGLALDIYNYFEFEEIESGTEILGVEDKYKNDRNLVYRSMKRTLDHLSYEAKGIRIRMDSHIPIARGLGSSASCVVGGVMGANLLAGNILSKDQVLNLATEIEGHPDNVAPAIFGGLVTSTKTQGQVLHNGIRVSEGIKFLALIPEFSLSTKRSREVLPRNVNSRDAVFNISRVSLLLSVFMNGNYDLLKYGLQDKLHEPYRGRIIPDYFKIKKEIDRLGALGSYLSGAGPTIMVVLDEEDQNFEKEILAYLDQTKNKWITRILTIDNQGARLD